MGIEIYWADEAQTTIQYDFIGTWNWDEFYRKYDQAIQMMESVDHRVDVIGNFEFSAGLPDNVLTHLKHIVSRQPANARMVLLVTRDLLFKMLLETASRLHQEVRRSYQIVPSMEEAHYLIKEDRLLCKRQAFTMR